MEPLIERLAEAQYAYRQHCRCEQRHRGKVRPEHLKPDPFEENSANDNEEITQGINESKPLQELRHSRDRESEAGENIERVHEKEVESECLLLGL